MADKIVDFSLTGEFLEKGRSDDLGFVYGWASVIEKNGVAVVDHQDDMMDEPTMTKMAHDFMVGSRNGKVLHKGQVLGTVVESMVFTKDLQKALGISLDRVGWLILMKIDDPALKARVKKGELRAFSIGGKAKRIAA